MAGLTLAQIAPSTYLIAAPANIGVYVRDNKAILIDSGNDKEAGRQILKLLHAQGWELELIVNTHSNADHIGGNAFLQSRTNCRIAATALEAAFINHPLLEASFLFGAFPHPGLRNKFLLAQESVVTDIIPSSGPILATGLLAVPLPGHYFAMVGVKTPDDVFFVADGVFPAAILEKYHLAFLYDLQGQLETLEMLMSASARLFVPGHGKPGENIAPLAEINLRKIEEIRGFLTGALEKPLIFEEILALVCFRFSLSLDANQYVLVGSTVRSYLAYLAAKDRLAVSFNAGKMYWQAR